MLRNCCCSTSPFCCFHYSKENYIFMKIKIDDNFLFSSLGFGEKYSRFCMIPTMLYRSFKYLRYRPPNMMIFEWRTPILKYKRHLCNSLYKKPKKKKNIINMKYLCAVEPLKRYGDERKSQSIFVLTNVCISQRKFGEETQSFSEGRKSIEIYFCLPSHISF